MSEQVGVDAPKRSRTASSRPVDPESTGSIAVTDTGPEDDDAERADEASLLGYGTVVGGSAPTTTTASPDASSSSTDTTADDDESRNPLDAARALLTARPRGPIRARRVHRIIRRIDPWSVLKLSLLFYFCVWIISMIALVLLWGVAVSSGTVESLENALAEILAFEELRFNGDQLFQLVALGGLIGVFVATAISAVLAVLFNLLANLTGGIRTTVIEEETARRVLRNR